MFNSDDRQKTVTFSVATRLCIPPNTRITFMFSLGMFYLLGIMIEPNFLQAETTYKLKIATIAPDHTPWSKLLKRFKKKVKKASHKRLIPRVYLSGLKGDEKSIVEQVYKGSLQMGGVSTGALASIVPEMDILELPYAFKNFESADRILNKVRPLIQEILAGKGLKLLIYSENGYRSFASQIGCIHSPADLQGVKMRAQESPVHVETYRALGASPISISASEVLPALQTGLVKGFDNTAIISQVLGWSQAIKYYSKTRHIYQPALIIVNKAWFDALPQDLQEIMLKYANKLENKGKKKVRDLEPGLMKNFDKMDVEVCEVTEAQRDVFKQATRKVWEIRSKTASKKGKQLISILKKEAGIP
jgi:TRAP-type transport system periplasmic protein